MGMGRRPRREHDRAVRILVSSTWGAGHVFPMVPLARALVDAGHEVRWYAPEPAYPLVAAAGLSAHRGGLTAADVKDVRARALAGLHQLPLEERRAHAFPRLFGPDAASTMGRDLLPAARDWRPDLLIHEPAELAAPLVAALVGAPLVTHSWGAPVPPRLLDLTAKALAPWWAGHGLDVPAHAGQFTDGYLHLCPPSLDFVSTAHVTSRVLPLRPGGYAGPDAAYDPPSDGRPLVYITLGTVATNPVVQQAALDAALECGARVLVTVGHQGDPDALDTRGGPVAVERFVPQTQVLRHASVLVSHAGAGSFLGAFAAGIPQLCLPQEADQFDNAAVVVQSGAGRSLRPGEVTVETVRAALGRLLGEPEPRRRAQELARDLAAMPTPAEVAAALTT